ncbi:glycoside hydrolase family 2 protein [Lutibacter citreus]|uniref:glycoside hydrolase family 2 protein n=1 Tax=Lutibacter citreus TaxID=2138210 RepID=UPI000DBE01BF|nr:glycoside hydrolase family 2 TIM barrel-domain containing protein [Lutibacter citreus]
MKISKLIILSVLIFASCKNIDKNEKRKVISLNGIWQIEESNLSDEIPESFFKNVPVPGLIDLATPKAFDSIGYPTSYKRYFWYKKEFQIDEDVPDVALIKLYKAKYTMKVFLNGNFVGEQGYNFTPALFNIKPYLKNKGKNELLVRISTYDNLPANVADGHDFEKKRYIPGIYDNVELILSGKEFIENVQIVPNIENNEVRVVAKLKSEAENSTLKYRVLEYKSGKEVISGETSSHDFKVKIPNCKLWSPENPFLYTLELETNSDKLSTRFGMRSFRLDSKTGLAYLNGKPYYLRGTNTCIFRFFEDPDRKELPWNKDWVRNLHQKFKTMHWNSIRYCIGFPPEIWYEIADEEGFLIQDEFPIWYGKWNQINKLGRDLTQLHLEYEQWMKDRWNHPCVVIWDAQNETRTEHTGNAINKVRHLDLSNRPWDNGWSTPMHKNDVQEVHPYLYNKFHKKNAELPKNLLQFALDTVRIPDNGPSEISPKMSGEKYPNPYIINEYAWLWINRNGTPTRLTEHLYPKAFGKKTAQELYYIYARHFSMKTEYWRAHRKCAGIMHFCALGYSRPNEPKGETSDNFIDIKNLIFEPTFEKYTKDAFSPILPFIDFWEPTVKKNSKENIEIIMINDTYSDWEGKLRLMLKKDVKIISEISKQVSIDELGKISVSFPIEFDVEPGSYSLVTEIMYKGEEVQSIREFEVK